MLLAGLDSERTRAFFEETWNQFDSQKSFPKPALIAVAHALGSHLPFFDQLGLCFGRVLFMPKERSRDNAVVTKMAAKAGWIQSPYFESDIAYSAGTGQSIAISLALGPGDPVFIIDVGGKWAAGQATALRELLGQRDVHVVEGTENGFVKYEALLKELTQTELEKLHVWSMARSHLKDAEDSLTGKAIVEATETIVRVNYGLLGDHPATVFGYGKIGKSVAHALRDKHLAVGVVEVKPLLAIQAQADGFEIRNQSQAQAQGGYIFLATGSAKRPGGLHLDLLRGMKRDALVTFVTSVDDELKGVDEFLTEGWLRPMHDRKTSELLGATLNIQGPSRVREYLLAHLHYLPGTSHAKVIIVNEGSPPNFLFEASCGPYIFMVFFGMLACLYRSWQGRSVDGQINQLAPEDENRIADTWLTNFGPQRPPREHANCAV
jgi:adenosylhomocysteinase